MNEEQVDSGVTQHSGVILNCPSYKSPPYSGLLSITSLEGL